MMIRRFGRTILAAATAGSLLLGAEAAGLARLAAIGGAIAVVGAGEAEAQARRSSGGYSRPSSAPSRRPSVGSPSAPSRTPSTARPSAPSSGGGGWTRSTGTPVPRTATPPAASRPSAPPLGDGGWTVRRPTTAPSGGDAAIGRRQSVDALGEYRAQAEQLRRDQERFQRPPTASVPSTPRGPVASAPRYERYDDWRNDRDRYYRDQNWSPPPHTYRSSPSFGMWDALTLWFLLDNLNRPGSLDFFHNNRNDPGLAEWRREAERLGQDNAELRGKLRDLDGGLARTEGRPVEPGYVPPGTRPGVVLAPSAAVERRAAPASSGSGLLWIVLLVGGGVIVFLWLRRRRAREAAAEGARPSVDAPAAKGGIYRPAPFRVGMTVDLDPSPFLLTEGRTKVVAPPAGAQTSVEAIGTLESDGVTLHRLYMHDGRAFLQIHLAADGNPDECRYFSLIDTVRPASADEWAFWLDAREGMIGWPEFQTKDGASYPRLWSEGAGRVAPIAFRETRSDHRGGSAASHAAMLYGAALEGTPPAPQAEYILVDMVEAEGDARVEIHAGIDINPAMLSLH